MSPFSIRPSIGTENPIPEEMDNCEIAVRVLMMNEVRFLFPSEPCKPLKPRSVYVVLLVEERYRHRPQGLSPANRRAASCPTNFGRGTPSGSFQPKRLPHTTCLARRSRRSSTAMGISFGALGYRSNRLRAISPLSGKPLSGALRLLLHAAWMLSTAILPVRRSSRVSKETF